MWVFLIIIIIGAIIYYKFAGSSKSKNNLSTKKENSADEMIKQEAIETLDAGEGFAGVPDFYTWDDLIPSKVMIKSKVSLDDIQNSLSAVMKTKDYEVEFKRARIKYGGSFNKTYEDCLIMSNPNAPVKYFDFIFTVNLNGAYSIIRTYRSATSYNNHWINELQSRKNETNDVLAMLNLMDNSMNKRNIKEYEDGWSVEYLYYTAVQEAVKEIFGI